MANFGTIFVVATFLILVPSTRAGASDTLTADSEKVLRGLFTGSQKCMDDIKSVVQKASTNVDIALQILRRLERQRDELDEAGKLLGSSGPIAKEAGYRAMYFVKTYFLALQQQLEYGMGLIHKSGLRRMFLECQEQVDIDILEIRKRDYSI